MAAPPQRFAITLYDNVPSDPRELPFRADQVVEILSEGPPGWCKAKLGTRTGLVPKNYIKEQTGSYRNLVSNVAADAVAASATNAYVNLTPGAGGGVTLTPGAAAAAAGAAPAAKRSATASKTGTGTPGGFHYVNIDVVHATAQAAIDGGAKNKVPGFPTVDQSVVSKIMSLHKGLHTSADDASSHSLQELAQSRESFRFDVKRVHEDANAFVRFVERIVDKFDGASAETLVLSFRYHLSKMRELIGAVHEHAATIMATPLPTAFVKLKEALHELSEQSRIITERISSLQANSADLPKPKGLVEFKPVERGGNAPAGAAFVSSEGEYIVKSPEQSPAGGASEPTYVMVNAISKASVPLYATHPSTAADDSDLYEIVIERRDGSKDTVNEEYSVVRYGARGQQGRVDLLRRELGATKSSQRKKSGIDEQLESEILASVSTIKDHLMALTKARQQCNDVLAKKQYKSIAQHVKAMISSSYDIVAGVDMLGNRPQAAWVVAKCQPISVKLEESTKAMVAATKVIISRPGPDHAKPLQAAVKQVVEHAMQVLEVVKQNLRANIA